MKKYLFVFAAVIFSSIAVAAPVVCKTLVDDAKYALKEINANQCWQTIIPLGDDIEFDLENGSDTRQIWKIEKYDSSICRIKMENDYDGVPPFRKNYAEIEIEARRQGKCDIVFVHPSGKRFTVKLEVR